MRATELCLKRLSRNRNSLSDRQLSHFLQLARNQIASQIVSEADPGTPGERENVLKPLLEVITCEDDPLTKERLTFIYKMFVGQGLRISRNLVLKTCASEMTLFPSKRAVEDTLDTLRGAYEAVRLLDGELFVAPEYLAGG